MVKNRKLIFLHVFFLLIECLVTSLHLVHYMFQPLPEEDVYSSTIKSVVELKSVNTNGDVLFGSGVIFDNSGILCTNAHLVTYKKSGVYHKFEKFEARFAFEEEYHQSLLLKYDIEQDIAFLKILDAKSLNLTSIHLEKSNELKTGSEVYAIGNAMNQGLSITKGTVSLARVNIQYDGFIREMIQCDLTINEGDSGGALLNAFGNMIGMPSFRLKHNGETIQGIAYCIPVNKILDCYEKTNA